MQSQNIYASETFSNHRCSCRVIHAQLGDPSSFPSQRPDSTQVLLTELAEIEGYSTGELALRALALDTWY